MPDANLVAALAILAGAPREASAAVGYRDLWAFLEGQADWPATVARIQQRTRQYAKRQLTWFRHLPECQCVTAELTRMRWEKTME